MGGETTAFEIYFRFPMMALDNCVDIGIVIDCNRERCVPVP